MPPDADGPSPNLPDAIQALCPACGLCCDGTLFADVRVRRADQPDRLARLGFVLETHGRRIGFPQPCRAFDGVHCGAYLARPRHCREFECGLLHAVATNQRTVPSALRRIEIARGQVRRLHGLLAQLGDTDPALPLVRRYAKAMQQPLDLARPAQTRLRSRLLRDMSRWMQRAEREFLTLTATRRGTPPDRATPVP